MKTFLIQIENNMQLDIEWIIVDDYNQGVSWSNHKSPVNIIDGQFSFS